MMRAAHLIEESESNETMLLRMIQFKGARSRSNLIVVEGNDDVTFVDAVLARYNYSAKRSSAVFNAEGKENVLCLFDLVNESFELDKNEYWFIVDADFDGARGRSDHPRLWVTPTYSFENMLVSGEVLESLLVAEYRCNDVAGTGDIDNIISIEFQKFLYSHEETLKFPNLCIYYCMKQRISTRGHDETITQYISAEFPNIKLSVSEEDILRRMPKNGQLDRALVEAFSIEFSALNPTLHWRGKFLFAGFISFLEALKKDRGSKTPKYFSCRRRMSFNPCTDPIRAMASIAKLPESLISFARSIPS